MLLYWVVMAVMNGVGVWMWFMMPSVFVMVVM
jgi:hypothetical protein